MVRFRPGAKTISQRVLPLAMSVVVIVFVGSAVYTEILLNEDADAIDIASNAGPSVAELADARAALRPLASAGDEAVTAHSPGVAEARTRYEQERSRLQGALAEYERTPDYPGERALYDRALVELAHIDALVRGTEAPGAHADPRAELNQRFDALETKLRAVSELNRDHLRLARAAIARRNRHRALWLLALEAAGVLVAAGITVLMSRTIGRSLATFARRSKELQHLALEVAHELATPLTPIEVALVAVEPALAGKEQAALERARRAIQRIRDSLGRLSAFASAGIAPLEATAHASIAAVVADVGRALALRVEAVGDWSVACGEPVLRSIVTNFFAGSLAGGAVLDTLVRVTATTEVVRVVLTRPAQGDRGIDPFDPQLQVPGTPHPGLDLRMATARRQVEAYGGRVGARRRRRRDELFIELPRV